MSIGVPIKVLHEAEGHIVTCETITGEVYRGKLIEAEDNMNCQMTQITVTYRDGRTSNLENVYIRGSKIRFLILPDMLKNAPMFKKQGTKAAGRGKSAILRAQGSGDCGPKIRQFLILFLYFQRLVAEAEADHLDEEVVAVVLGGEEHGRVDLLVVGEEGDFKFKNTYCIHLKINSISNYITFRKVCIFIAIGVVMVNCWMQSIYHPLLIQFNFSCPICLGFDI